MKKDDVIAAGISEEVAAFVMSEQRNNRILNQEGMEVGDKITIVGVADKVSSFTGEDGKVRQYVEVMTTGDRNSISISRLVGTSKRAKYFGDDYATKYGKILELPRHEGDALIEVTKLIGHTFVVAAIAEECGQFSQTFYLFAEA